MARLTLAYGRMPSPGTVECRREADGSLTVEIVPRSLAQIGITVAGMAAALVPFAIAMLIVWHYRAMERTMIFIGGFVLVMLVPAALFVLFTISRQEMRIIASTKGLRIWRREYGDDVTYDFERERIVWVDMASAPEDREGVSIGLLVVLQDTYRWYAIHRKREQILPLGRALREALEMRERPTRDIVSPA